MSGHIRQRSAGSWEIRWRADGQVRTRTVRGSKADAQRALRAALVDVDQGEHVDPSKLTVAELVAERLTIWTISARTREHYEQLGRLIATYLGDCRVQKLTTIDVERWHGTLRANGLAPSTIRHAHGLLVRVLSDALRHRMVARNVAREQPAPKATPGEIKLPTENQIGPMLAKLAGNEFHAPAVVTVYCGLRRGELLALRWCDIDLDRALLTIARAVDETRASGIAIKSPKTASGVRTISLPQIVVEALREHRRRQLEQCLLLGRGRPPASALVFPGTDGQPQSPRAFSKRWLRTVRRLKLPAVTWHGLRHLHCSLLLRRCVDLATASRRLGHSRVDTTARVYAHAIAKDDRHAAAALDLVAAQ